MSNRRIAVLTPLLNDWASLERLAAALAAMAGDLGTVTLFVVDDGSTEEPDRGRLASAADGLAELRIVRLSCNLGHQRAIAIGLALLAQQRLFDLVVVMDSDGEDRPEDIPKLLERHASSPGAIVVAQRAERSEGAAFTVLYAAYRAAFHTCTGVSIDFGNFCLIPGALLDRLVSRPEIWNHLAATVIKSRTPIERVPTARGLRYAGESRMNLVSLVAHGLSGISVFVTEVFVRFLVVACAVIMLFLGIIGTALAVRLFSDLAIPGWATTVVGLSFIVLLQLLTMAAALTFVMLSNRLAAPVVATVHGRSYVQSIDVLAGT